jgi:hypothetical protein
MYIAGVTDDVRSSATGTSFDPSSQASELLRKIAALDLKRDRRERRWR